jgi:outer membrane protein assembly factor BamB
VDPLNNRARLTIVVVVILIVIASGVTYTFVRPLSTKAPSTTYTGPASCPSRGATAIDGNWTTYHQDNAREGALPANVTSAKIGWNAPVSLDGQIYAEPLVCGNAVFAVTEEDTVYAVNATGGTLLWRTHLGTPVPGSSLPCGNIDPSGITGTPVIDASSGTLYVVAFLDPGHHVLFGLSVRNGSVVSQVSVDPPGADPTAHQQRGALALAGGMVYVPFGGLDGDCAPYHGWVVGVHTNGAPGLTSYQVPTHREGGIWSVGGISVASNGSLFVATGNGDSTTAFDHGESVIELSPSLAEADYFAPTDWAGLNANDTDLGSVAPTLLPGGEVFQVGKAGVGYLLSASHLGGIGGQLAEAPICGGAYGGTAHLGRSIFVPCTDGLYDVVAGTSNLSVAWHSGRFDAGSPIVTGNLVWTVNLSTSDLVGLDLYSGKVVFTFALGSVDHFISPAAAPGWIYVGAGTQLLAFATA